MTNPISSRPVLRPRLGSGPTKSRRICVFSSESRNQTRLGKKVRALASELTLQARTNASLRLARAVWPTSALNSYIYSQAFLLTCDDTTVRRGIASNPAPRTRAVPNSARIDIGSTFAAGAPATTGFWIFLHFATRIFAGTLMDAWPGVLPRRTKDPPAPSGFLFAEQLR